PPGEGPLEVSVRLALAMPRLPRLDPLGAVLTALGAAALVLLPFVVLKPNRILPGEPVAMLAALPGWGAFACQAILALAARAALAGAVPRALHRRRRPRARARHLRQSLRDARVHGERRSLRPRGATARVARVRFAHRRLHRGAAARHPLPPRAKAARPRVGRPQRHPDHSGDRALRDP